MHSFLVLGVFEECHSLVLIARQFNEGALFFQLLNSQYHMQVTALEQEKISNEELNGDHKKRNTKLENK